MTEEEVVSVFYTHYQGLFPKHCSVCDRVYESLEAYLRQVERLGESSFMDSGDADPIGTSTMFNCSCGNTLALTTATLSAHLRYQISRWIRQESLALGQTANDITEKIHLLVQLRARRTT